MNDMHNNRLHRRHAFSADAVLYYSTNWHKLRCRVVDLSDGGAGLSYDPLAGPIVPGTKTKFAIDGIGQVEAEVRWCSFGKIGIAFIGLEATKTRFLRAVKDADAAS